MFSGMVLPPFIVVNHLYNYSCAQYRQFSLECGPEYIYNKYRCLLLGHFPQPFIISQVVKIRQLRTLEIKLSIAPCCVTPWYIIQSLISSSPPTPRRPLYPSPKGLVIIYREGKLQNGKPVGPNFLRPPPSPQERIKPFAPPPFQRVETFHAPLQYG